MRKILPGQRFCVGLNPLPFCPLPPASCLFPTTRLIQQPLITTAKFSEQAKSYYPKNETKVVLIDGEELAEYMIDFELGVSTVSEYKLKKIDTDYFEAL